MIGKLSVAHTSLYAFVSHRSTHPTVDHFQTRCQLIQELVPLIYNLYGVICIHNTKVTLSVHYVSLSNDV